MSHRGRPAPGQRPKPPRCTKVKYPNQNAALAALRGMGVGRFECRVYRCAKHNKACWHMTSREA